MQLQLDPERIECVLGHQQHERLALLQLTLDLIAEEVPLLARIVAVADAFDSMTSLRAYRASMSLEDAVRELRVNLGKQFDPKVVAAFLDSLSAVKESEQSSN